MFENMIRQENARSKDEGTQNNPLGGPSLGPTEQCRGKNHDTWHQCVNEHIHNFGARQNLSIPGVPGIRGIPGLLRLPGIPGIQACAGIRGREIDPAAINVRGVEQLV